MAHCPKEMLEDIDDVLSEIRLFEKIKEKSFGIFYFKSKPFLHFHISGDERWADVKDGETWGKKIPLKFKPSKKDKKEFLQEVARRFSDLN